ncbi:hypothetical protein ACXZ66_09725 [Corynebacterium sp. S7]
MAQEQFAGPEYNISFDPEKFIRDLKVQAEQKHVEEEQERSDDDNSQAE